MRAVLENSWSARECRPDYGVKVHPKAELSVMIKLCSQYILHAGFEFIRGHCGKVANKAPSGS